MIESSHSQNLVCENDILIVDVVSDAEELTYDNWSISIKKYLETEGLWDIIENNEVVRGDDNEVARAENNEVAAGAGTNEVARAEDRDWIEKNAKALYLIMESCGSKRFSLINTDSAKDAWHALRDADMNEFMLKSGSYSSPLRRKYTCSIFLK